MNKTSTIERGYGDPQKRDRPASRDGMRIILPNSFTFSYRNENFTACQHDILLLVFESLQGYMTSSAPHELTIEQKVTIDTTEIMGNRNKEHVLEAARKLQSLEFGFRYIRDELGNVNRVWGVFVTTVEDIKDTPYMRLTINKDIFPVLTYYGESVGGTLLLKEPSLETKGKHAKTIREMLISRRGIGYFKEDLDEFKRMLGLSEHYRPACLKKDILEPVRQYLQQNSDIWFEYEMIKERVPGRKARCSSIYFWIYTEESGRLSAKQNFNDYSLVHTWITSLTGDPMDHRNISVTDSLSESGRLHHLASKCRFYGREVRCGNIKRGHAENIIRKILKDDYGIQI